MADRFLYQGLAEPPPGATTAESTFPLNQDPQPTPRPRRRQLGYSVIYVAEGATTEETAFPAVLYPGPTPRPRPRRPFVGAVDVPEGTSEPETAFPPVMYPGPTPRPRPRRPFVGLTDTPEGATLAEDGLPLYVLAMPPARSRPVPAIDQPDGNDHAAPAADLSLEMPPGELSTPRRSARRQQAAVEYTPEETAAPPDLSQLMPFTLDAIPQRRLPRRQHMAATLDLTSGVSIVGLDYPTVGYTLPDAKLGYTLDVGLPEYTLPPAKLGYTLE